MDKREKKKIGQQLAAQAALFTAEEEDRDLVEGILQTCLALLGIAERMMPEEASGEELEDMLSVYLGIAGSIKRFCRERGEAVTGAETGMLTDIAKELDACLGRKTELEKSVQERQGELSDLKEEISAIEENAKEVKEACLAAKREKDLLEKERESLWDRQKELAAQKVSLEKEVGQFEENIGDLVESVEALRDSYRELTAYYPELERIKRGLGQDGYVEMKSLSEAFEQMETEGEKLMEGYDRLLKNLLLDVEEVQNRIEDRRKR